MNFKHRLFKGYLFKEVLCLILCYSLFYRCINTPVFPFPNACFLPPDEEIFAGDDVSFTNCSVNTDSYLWDFGDGFSSEEQNPTHKYRAPGVYSVTLTATGKAGRLTTSKEISVNFNSYLAVNGTKYPLRKGDLVHWKGIVEWHTLCLSSDISYSPFKGDIIGSGNIVLMKVLSVTSFDVRGSYAFNANPFEGTIKEFESMQPGTVYNGFSAIAHGFNYRNGTPSANDYSKGVIEDFHMNISREGKLNMGIYKIDISCTIDGNTIEVLFIGNLNNYHLLYEHNDV